MVVVIFPPDSSKIMIPAATSHFFNVPPHKPSILPLARYAKPNEAEPILKHPRDISLILPNILYLFFLLVFFSAENVATKRASFNFLRSDTFILSPFKNAPSFLEA